MQSEKDFISFCRAHRLRLSFDEDRTPTVHSRPSRRYGASLGYFFGPDRLALSFMSNSIRQAKNRLGSVRVPHEIAGPFRMVKKRARA